MSDIIRTLSEMYQFLGFYLCLRGARGEKDLTLFTWPWCGKGEQRQNSLGQATTLVQTLPCTRCSCKENQMKEGERVIECKIDR